MPLFFLSVKIYSFYNIIFTTFLKITVSKTKQEARVRSGKQEDCEVLLVIFLSEYFQTFAGVKFNFFFYN